VAALESSTALFKRCVTGKVICELTHTYGFHCRILRRNIQGYQFLDFIQRALLHHFRKAVIDPAVKNRAIGFDHDATGVSGIDGHGSAAPLKARDRPSARHHHLQCPHDALTVCRAQPGGHLRIEPGKLGMERFDPLLLKPRAQRFSDFGRDGRHVGEAAGECAEVKPGSADDNRIDPRALMPAMASVACSSQMPVE
jgi:hypothetical protein